MDGIPPKFGTIQKLVQIRGCGAGGQMNATQWAAWVGAGSGVGSLAWNIYSKFTTGRPDLTLAAVSNFVKDSDYPQTRSIQVVLQNRGSAPTTVTEMKMYAYRSWWRRWWQQSYIAKVGLAYQAEPHFLPFLLD